MLLAINYLHTLGVVHRDLSCHNILLTSSNLENFEIKVIDLGFACYYGNRGLDNYIVGSPCYQAPEILKQKPYNQKVDIWSIGVITFMLLSCRMLFKTTQSNDLINESPVLPIINHLCKDISDKGKDFL